MIYLVRERIRLLLLLRQLFSVIFFRFFIGKNLREWFCNYVVCHSRELEEDMFHCFDENGEETKWKKFRPILLSTSSIRKKSNFKSRSAKGHAQFIFLAKLRNRTGSHFGSRKHGEKRSLFRSLFMESWITCRHQEHHSSSYHKILLRKQDIFHIRGRLKSD